MEELCLYLFYRLWKRFAYVIKILCSESKRGEYFNKEGMIIKIIFVEQLRKWDLKKVLVI